MTSRRQSWSPEQRWPRFRRRGRCGQRRGRAGASADAQALRPRPLPELHDRKGPTCSKADWPKYQEFTGVWGFGHL
eukprot:8556175-Lingulodinium_polyedra.AAC.1